MPCQTPKDLNLYHTIKKKKLSLLVQITNHKWDIGHKKLLTRLQNLCDGEGKKTNTMNHNIAFTSMLVS